MTNDPKLTNTSLRTPKAAAVAGILFSLLTIAIFCVLRISFPVEPRAALTRLNTNAATIAFAVNLVPFAGVAFLWFIGVLRDRLGQREDRFFATVFLGSGLLFVATFFVAGAIIASILVIFGARPNQPIDPDHFAFTRNLAFTLMNTFAVKMAAVFMLSMSTVIARTGAAPRYLAYLGGLAGVFLLIASQSSDWSFLVFPVWVLLLSTQILIENLRALPNPGSDPG